MIILDDPDDERYAAFRLNERGLASRADKRDDAGAGLFLAEGVLRTEITSRILGRGLLDNSDISFSTKQG